MTLPEIASYRLRFRALGDQMLAALPTNGVRGALGHALRLRACVASGETSCGTCRHAPGCVYNLLFEPPGRPGAGLGVTDHAPGPLVLAPEAPVRSSSPMLLRRGELLDVRLGLIGAFAASCRDAVVAALRDGAGRGIGLSLSDEHEKVPLDLVSVEPIAPVEVPQRGPVVLEFVSPVRLRYEGKVRGEIDADALLGAIVRRADTLARLYGGGPVADTVGRLDLRVVGRRTHVLPVTRYSSRQARRMNLPGVVGTVVLEGDIEKMGRWLAFGERAQIGKGTSFGFGRYWLTDGG